MAPKIIFEDDSLLLVDKPAGITVNKSDTTIHEKTLQDWVEDYLKVSKGKNVSKVSNGGTNPSDTFDTSPTFDTFRQRAGIVHRLDKETSGILIVAKTEEAFIKLQAQFKERVVKKTYKALVHGEVKLMEGEINVPVGRLPWNRKQFGVVAGGRDALTRYRVASLFFYPKTGERLSLLELHPETGRTHQIRVHLKYFNHPIFSDYLYAGRKTARADRLLLSRVFLHAARISFAHPITGNSLTFESELPNELSSFLTSLQRLN